MGHMYSKEQLLEANNNPDSEFAQKVFTDIARQDNDGFNRVMSAKKLHDKTLAQEIFTSHAIQKGWWRKLAIEETTDQKVLADIAKNDNDIELLLIAVDRLSDQKALEDVALHAKSEDIRKKAVLKLTDSKVLLDVAKHDNHSGVRYVALTRLTDITALAESADNEKQ